jgi:hypothetical protein
LAGVSLLDEVAGGFHDYRLVDERVLDTHHRTIVLLNLYRFVLRVAKDGGGGGGEQGGDVGGEGRTDGEREKGAVNV